MNTLLLTAGLRPSLCRLGTGNMIAARTLAVSRPLSAEPVENKFFKKVLIANRGEIACRVIKTARKCGVRTVAVYSDADAKAMHVEMADEAHNIGGNLPQESYLRIDRIIDVAKRTGAEAVHPGYGFLSENAEFSDALNDNGIKFVGPPAEAMRAMASKSAAKYIMSDAGVPVVPGYHGEEQSVEYLAEQAAEIGYPVLIKAIMGGGGKGMRIVGDRAGLEEAILLAQREAAASFGDARILIEKYIQKPRHVEVQVFSDSHDQHVYLWDRDCSVQRRYQKIIEEAPAPGLDDALRTEMGVAATNAARAVRYEGAGTVEFIVDRDTDKFYFMEMNTRLQVEHPVSEMITQQDLVEWQLKIAAGQRLPLKQEEIPRVGHAFEARIYAENPRKDFMPGSGTIKYMRTPQESLPNVRVDTGIREGDTVSVFYDPMIAKLITWDHDRNRALQQLRTALHKFRISGLNTNIQFLGDLASHPQFIGEDLDTGFIPRYKEELFPTLEATPSKHFVLATLGSLLSARYQQHSTLSSSVQNDPWSVLDDFRVNHNSSASLRFIDSLNGDEKVRVEVECLEGNTFNAGVYRGDSKTADAEYKGIRADLDENGDIVYTMDKAREVCSFYKAEDNLGIDLFLQNDRASLTLEEVKLGGLDAKGSGSLIAPVTGQVTKILVKVGDQVEKGQPILVMSAMKMEYIIRSQVSGTMKSINCKESQIVNEKVVVAHLEVPEEEKE